VVIDDGIFVPWKGACCAGSVEQHTHPVWVDLTSLGHALTDCKVGVVEVGAVQSPQLLNQSTKAHV